MAEQAGVPPDTDRVRELIRELVGTETQLQEVLGVGVDAVLDPETGMPIVLQRAQAELRLLLEQLPAIAWTVDRELRYTSLQGTGLAAVNLRPGDLLGRHVAAISPVGTPSQNVLEAHRRALDGQPADLIVHHGGWVWQVHVEALRN
ncbi:MAG TPA: hypothetical protein VLC52_15240, partial [Anaerolineae bacterium]|nr:hypothetical protein [Anaerolineae bacterium]